MAPSPQQPLSEAARQRLHANIAAIRGRIAEVCRTASRPLDSVRLVAVTKYVSADIARALLDMGVTDLAESRPQALWDKAMALADTAVPPQWHFIGHLQRNKVRRTLPLLAMLQSLDSLRLLATLEADAQKLGETTASPTPPRSLDILVEVNLTDDPGRSGTPFDSAAALVEAAARSPFVRLRGLMGMAARPDLGIDARSDFARLRALRDRLASASADPSMLCELSMGMSEDFEAGILEGATIVRIGSALFDGLA